MNTMMASHNLERIACGSVPGGLGVRIVEKKNTDGGLRKGGGCHHSANNKIFQQLSKTEGTMPATMSLDARVQEELTKCTCIYNSPKFEESGVNFHEVGQMNSGYCCHAALLLSTNKDSLVIILEWFGSQSQTIYILVDLGPEDYSTRFNNTK